MPPRRNRSLVKTLIIRITAATVVAAALILAGLHLHLTLQVDTLWDRSLSGQAADILRHIKDSGGGQLALDLPVELNRAYADPNGQFQFQVRGPEGAVLFSSGGGALALDQVESRGLAAREFYLLKGPTQPKIHAAAVPVLGPTGALVIVVGQGTGHDDVLVDDLLEDSLLTIGLVTIPILAVLIIVNVVTIRRGLAPIKKASEQAASIGPQSGGLRLSEADIPEEVRPLVHAVNSAFDRLEHAVEVQREFAADAAHELRTPLAVLGAHLDALGDRAVASALGDDLAAMRRIVDQLLRAAELDSFAVKAGETTDLCRVVSEVASFMAPLALKQDKSLGVTGIERPVMVQGNAAALYHALRNLLENALAHTPTGTGVDIRVTPEGVVDVMDRGPGVPAEQRELIFRRFWRGDRSRTGGAGLGLAIVARITEAHGGTITVGDAEGGGARFSLTLPLAADLAVTEDAGQAPPKHQHPDQALSLKAPAA